MEDWFSPISPNSLIIDISKDRKIDVNIRTKPHMIKSIFGGSFPFFYYEKVKIDKRNERIMVELHMRRSEDLLKYYHLILRSKIHPKSTVKITLTNPNTIKTITLSNPLDRFVTSIVYENEHPMKCFVLMFRAMTIDFDVNKKHLKEYAVY